jgi:hypothetical protein
MKITTKSGKTRIIKNYDIGVGAYLKKGFVKGIHKTTGNKRFFKLK